MKTHALLVALAALSLSGGLAVAQTGQPGRTPETGQTGSSSAAADQSRGSRENVTVTGCLKQGGSGAETGTAGSTSSSASSNSSRSASGFMLTNARLGSGSTGSSMGSTHGGVYNVTGLSDAELQPHVNQQVQIMGRIDGGRDSTGSTGSSTGSSSSSSGSVSSASGMSEHAPRLHATSIKMMSASCSGGTE